MNNLPLSYEAQNDLSDIKDYIAEDLENPQAAIATLSKITKAICMLRDHALIGHASTDMLRHYQDVDLAALRRITDAL